MTDTDTVVFQGWPKIPRLNRNMLISEKIDGTNAGIHVTADGNVVAQSRNRLITPNVDNHGFAKWVYINAQTLAETLGEGLHFGEWWGSGIQRGYGLTKGEKRFSLFNVYRYQGIHVPEIGLDTVPLLCGAPFTTEHIEHTLAALKEFGSVAAPGFMDPEGIVIFHEGARHAFKVTIKNDEKPKGLAA